MAEGFTEGIAVGFISGMAIGMILGFLLANMTKKKEEPLGIMFERDQQGRIIAIYSVKK